MQVKYLSLALAAALAATLTGCGSDSDTNYNKPVVTPENPTNPTNPTDPTNPTNPTNPDDGKGSDVDNGGDKKPEEGGDKTPGSDIPEGDDPVNNPGDAAYDGDVATKSSVVGQQYVRHQASMFDRVLNKSSQNETNSTVLSFKTLQNPLMTNIVNGRETVQIQEVPYMLRRYAGQNNTKPNFNNAFALQVWNTKPENSNKVSDYINSLNNAGTAEYAGEQALAQKAKSAKVTNFGKVALDGKFIDSSSSSTDWDNGLVKITRDNNGNFSVVGQENAVYKMNKANPDQIEGVVVNGQNRPVRIFGALYNQIDGLNQLKANAPTSDNYKIGQNSANTWIYKVSPLGAANNLVVEGSANSVPSSPFNKYIEMTSASILKNATGDANIAAASQLGKSSKFASIGQENTLGLFAVSDKLRNVQYGRVTTNIDPIDAKTVEEDKAAGKQAIYLSPYQDKTQYSVGSLSAQQAADHTVDTYFYRGNHETTLEQMAALPKDQKIDYYGHALMYGIDNRLKQGNGLIDTNSFGQATSQVGLGNFVKATFDTASRKVNGSVYNVWLKDVNADPNSLQKNKSLLPFVDNLVTFQGDVVGNSIVGTANRTYVDTPDNAAFKGSFYGEKAGEMGGSFNSTTTGYNKLGWGGVFGAKAESVVESNANTID